MKFNDFGKRVCRRSSEIGFGGSRIGGVFADKHSAKRRAERSSEGAGFRHHFYDTADMYAREKANP